MVMSLPSHFNPKLHPKRTRVKKLGTKGEAHHIEVISHQVEVNHFPRLLGDRVRSYSWDAHPRLSAWALQNFDRSENDTIDRGETDKR